MLETRIFLPRTFIFVVILVLLIGSKIYPQTFKVELNAVHAEETTTYIVASGADHYSRPRINNNGEIVWSQTSDGAHTVWSNLREQISSGPLDYDPDINDSGEIIWRFGDGGQAPDGIWSNIRGLIYSEQGGPIDPYYDTHRINNTGEIVWSRSLWPTGYRAEEIWSNTRGRLTYSPEYTANRALAINDLGEVVYQSYSAAPGTNPYDILSTERGFIANTSSWEQEPDINNGGEVVWMQKEDEKWEIWSSTSGRITFNDTHDMHPSINNDGEIVWEHWDGSDWEIFSNFRGQITNNDVNDTEPHINDSGVVTWLANLGENISVLANKSSVIVDIEIQAHIDGRDQLIIQDNTLQWHHLDYAAVGRHLGANSPTIVYLGEGGHEWIPEWPEAPPAEIRYEAFSSLFENLNSVFPTNGAPFKVTKLFGRGEVEIIEQPTAENDYTLVVEFDDPQDGSNFYAIRLSQVQEVLIDIRPWKRVNRINLCEKGAFYITIFTTNTEDGDPLSFDATTVDPDSVRFGPAKATPIGHRMRDIDWDGDKDLLVRFKVGEMGISMGQTEASLTGYTYDGHLFTGTDSIKTVCK